MMKFRNNKYVGMFYLFFILSFISMPLSEIFYTNELIEQKNEINIRQGKSWNLTGNPIIIDDSDPTKNWSYTAAHYDWCRGSGTLLDPYIIENVTIDGQNSTNCIEILNSNVYFIIRNCTLYNSATYKAGLSLYKTSNGKLIDNHLSYNYIGIYLDNCNNNELKENNMTNNDAGIFLGNSNNNTLTKNRMNENYYGIY
ncbi:MAG: right-handed parallel beta-helix repeat-containing protein [Promethearchaeota archaeon]